MELIKMKYCYTCGCPYEEKYCPECFSALHTLKPNSQTRKNYGDNYEEERNSKTINVY
jgi:hypothetical protein